MAKRKSLNSFILMDKKDLARHLTNLTGIVKTDTCDKRWMHQCNLCGTYGFLEEMILDYDKGWLHQRCKEEFDQFKKDDEHWEMIQDAMREKKQRRIK